MHLSGVLTIRSSPSAVSLALIALALLFIGGGVSALFGATHEIRAVHVLVPDELRTGDICYQKAGRGVAAFPRDFASDVWTCQPAQAELTVKPGRFVIVGRVAGKYVSRPALIEVPAGGSEPVETALQAFPAASLIFDRSRIQGAPDALFGALVVRPPDGGPAFGLVLLRGTAELTVPAESPVLPVVVVNGAPIAIGAMQTLSAGERKSVGDIAGRGRAVFATVALWRRSGDALPPEPPQILLEREDGHRYAPAAHGGPGDSAAAYDGGVVVFQNVEPGRYDLVVRGRSWRRHSLPVVVNATSISMPKKSLTVAPGSRIAVRVLAAVPAQQNICGTLHPDVPSLPRIQLKRCADAVMATEHPARCPVIDEHWVQGTAAEFFADEGDYVLELTRGAVAMHEVLRVGREPIETTLELIPHTISGRITRGGHPVRAQLTMGAANAGSDDDGYYSIEVERGANRRSVRVQPCMERFTYTKEIPPATLSSGRLDVEIPATELFVTVRDGSTGLALDDAVVRVEKRTKNTRCERIDEVSATDGQHTFHAYDHDATIRVCATAAGYASACSDAFHFGKRDRREIELVLQPISR